MWGVTNLSREQRLGLTGSIMIGETVASNLNNMTALPTQNQLLANSTMGRNLAAMQQSSPQAPEVRTEIAPSGIAKDNLNNLSAGGAVGLVNGPSLHDINLAQTNHQMY